MQTNYFTVSHAIVESIEFKKLKHPTKILYFYMCHLQNRYGGNGSFFRSMADLTEDSGISIDSVKRGMIELVKGKFIYKTKGYTGKSNEYKILDFKKQWINYKEYLKSEEWKKKSKKALIRANFRCQLCNKKDEIHIHHRTYENLGNEKESDLIALCKGCHKKFHSK
jgi:hypothetical protein